MINSEISLPYLRFKRLKRKYGKDISELIIYQEKLELEINKIENYEESTSQLREQINELYQRVLDLFLSC